MPWHEDLQLNGWTVGTWAYPAQHLAETREDVTNRPAAGKGWQEGRQGCIGSGCLRVRLALCCLGTHVLPCCSSCGRRAQLWRGGALQP